MKGLNLILRNIFASVLLGTWIMGVVLAKGGISTMLSICIPFYAWYLVIEKLMINTGFI